MRYLQERVKRWTWEELVEAELERKLPPGYPMNFERQNAIAEKRRLTRRRITALRERKLKQSTLRWVTTI